MLAKHSPLIFLGSNFESTLIECIYADSQDINETLEQLRIEDYPLSIDYDHYESDGVFFVRLHVNINNTETPFVGYKISITCTGYFRAETAGLSEEYINNLLGVSTINILWGSVRGYLRNLTSYAPFGIYMLPSIDIADLILQKQAQPGA